MRQTTLVWTSGQLDIQIGSSAGQLFLFTFRRKKKTQIPETFHIDVRSGISNNYVLYA